MKLYSLLQMIHHFVKASMVWTVEPVSARFACLWNALVFTNLIIITCMYNAVTRVTYMYNVYVHFIADFMVRYTHTKTCTMWAWFLSSRNWFMSDLLHRYQVIKWMYGSSIYAPTQNTFIKFDLLLVFTRKHICAKWKILFKYLKSISTDMFLCL